jgi:DNA-binding SARP family transcriptional activator
MIERPICPLARILAGGISVSLALHGREGVVIQLALLGKLDLIGDDGAVLDAPLRQAKRVALLAYLTVARPIGYHRREKIAALFWPELPADRARAALRTTLSRLRDDHSAELILGRGADELAVDASRVRCDVREFDMAIETTRYADAVALYRGPFLDGVHVEGAGDELEDWIAGERLRLHGQLLRALAAMGDDAERRGELHLAVTAARQALAASPNDEGLARRVISLLIASGNHGGAMQMYDDFVRRLRAEHGVEPASETAALVARLRATAAPKQDSPVDKDAASNGETSALRADTNSLNITHRSSDSVPGRSRFQTTSFYAVTGLLLVVAWIATRPKPKPVPSPLVEWRQVLAIGHSVPAAFGARAVLDSTSDALLVFGGVVDVERKLIAPMSTYWRLRGLGSGDAATWTPLQTAEGVRPAPRWQSGASSDAARDRVIIHGGALGFSSPCANDTWVLNHASGIGHIPAWTQVRTRGLSPPARAAFDQVFDATRRRLIVFAGNDCTSPSFHDTWVLAFDDSTLKTGAWTLLVPDTSAGLPGNRDAHVTAYDTTSARLYVFGGRSSTVANGELWKLENASGSGGVPAWRPVRCSGDHPVLLHPASALDFESDSWIMFGGMDASNQVLRAVWQLNGLINDPGNCRWQQLAFTEPSPAGRVDASGALLPGARGMVIFGGEFRNTALSDVWVLRRERR